MSHLPFDFVVIGSGMSGLYAAYKIRKHQPNVRILLLESSNHIGGRALTEKFRGASISPGAGVGRFHKDRLLKRLMKELGFSVKPFPFQPNYSRKIKKIVDLNNVMNRLKTKFSKTSFNQTFESFARQHLGETMLRKFVLSSGYTDYLRESAYQTLYNYGMDDNMCCWRGFAVPWGELTSRMAQIIGQDNIQLNQKVREILNVGLGLYKIQTQNSIIYTKHVIVATAIDTVQKLFPKHSVYRYVNGQPFMRVFAQVSKDSVERIKQAVPRFTIVPGPLQKVIPIQADRGIFMVAYNDNANANIVNRNKSRKQMELWLEKSLGLPRGSIHIRYMKPYYWSIGTHYFRPGFDRKMLRKMQRPLENVWVVGEAFSLNQGWTEGALESVDRIKRYLHI